MTNYSLMSDGIDNINNIALKICNLFKKIITLQIGGKVVSS